VAVVVLAEQEVTEEILEMETFLQLVELVFNLQ
jgi:hypothetical protein